LLMWPKFPMEAVKAPTQLVYLMTGCTGTSISRQQYAITPFFIRHPIPIFLAIMLPTCSNWRCRRSAIESLRMPLVRGLAKNQTGCGDFCEFGVFQYISQYRKTQLGLVFKRIEFYGYVNISEPLVVIEALGRFFEYSRVFPSLRYWGIYIDRLYFLSAS